ncbi:MAG: BREX-3 system P-loop-containing protein BrxF [Opitutaceae bacterium]
MHRIDQTVADAINDATSLYHRLVLVVGPSGSGKTGAVRRVAISHPCPCLNVNLELSKQMLNLTGRQRSLQALTVLRDLIKDAGDDTVVLDNNEILFDRTLQLDPLRVLKELSRTKTIVATWNGHIDKNSLDYAEPDHPEYQHYPISEVDFVYVTTEGKEA